jgi:hypothetical protein
MEWKNVSTSLMEMQFSELGDDVKVVELGRRLVDEVVLLLVVVGVVEESTKVCVSEGPPESLFEPRVHVRVLAGDRQREVRVGGWERDELGVAEWVEWRISVWSIFGNGVINLIAI